MQCSIQCRLGQAWAGVSQRCRKHTKLPQVRRRRSPRRYASARARLATQRPLRPARPSLRSAHCAAPPFFRSHNDRRRLAAPARPHARRPPGRRVARGRGQHEGWPRLLDDDRQHRDGAPRRRALLLALCRRCAARRPLSSVQLASAVFARAQFSHWPERAARIPFRSPATSRTSAATRSRARTTSPT